MLHPQRSPGITQVRDLIPSAVHSGPPTGFCLSLSIRSDLESVPPEQTVDFKHHSNLAICFHNEPHVTLPFQDRAGRLIHPDCECSAHAYCT